MPFPLLSMLFLIADAARCEARILSYRAPPAAHDWRIAAAMPGGGAIAVFGAEHIRDPKHPQNAAIAAAFAAARPTLVLFEGPDRGTADGADTSIADMGESGYARFLARGAGVPARSLEPGPVDLVTAIKPRFSGDQITLFFVLREVARMRDREGRTGAALDAATAQLLGKTVALAKGAGLATTIRDLETLDAASRAVWPDRDWRTLPGGWFAPGAGPAEARFLPTVNTAVSETRDLHLFRQIAKAASTGARVFVVVGRDHVPMLADALRCAAKH